MTTISPNLHTAPSNEDCSFERITELKEQVDEECQEIDIANISAGVWQSGGRVGGGESGGRVGAEWETKLPFWGNS